ncbi:HAD family acid phosphatase [bacterium]|nr:HAD family acid phosphatase [bacterium]
MNMKNTIFCDIDGTIFKYRKFETFRTSPAVLTAGSFEKLNRWFDNGDMIILTTARPERMRDHTIRELQKAGVPYHKLIMGIRMGDRILINDTNPRRPGDRTFAYNVPRDEGLDFIGKRHDG